MLGAMEHGADLSSLRTRSVGWRDLAGSGLRGMETRKTGKPILDGIGATEMLHIFITNRLDDTSPGTTGRARDRLRGPDRGRRK